MRFLPTVLLLLVTVVARAQVPAPVTTIAPATAQRSLAATLNVYAFPGAGQTPAQQSVDETECYNWAVANTGVDPFQAAKDAAQAQAQAEQQKQQAAAASQGGAAKGAVRGAVAGVAVGAIAGDAGKGAAIGAGTGLVAGGASASGRKQQASQQANQQAAKATQLSAAQTDHFRKAFSACLEGKKYTVKY